MGLRQMAVNRIGFLMLSSGSPLASAKLAEFRLAARPQPKFVKW